MSTPQRKLLLTCRFCCNASWEIINTKGIVVRSPTPVHLHVNKQNIKPATYLHTRNVEKEEVIEISIQLRDQSLPSCYKIYIWFYVQCSTDLHWLVCKNKSKQDINYYRMMHPSIQHQSRLSKPSSIQKFTRKQKPYL